METISLGRRLGLITAGFAISVICQPIATKVHEILKKPESGEALPGNHSEMSHQSRLIPDEGLQKIIKERIKTGLECNIFTLEEENGTLHENMSELRTNEVFLRMRIEALLQSGKTEMGASKSGENVQLSRPGDLWSLDPETFEKAVREQLNPDGSINLDPQWGWKTPDEHLKTIKKDASQAPKKVRKLREF